MKINNNKTQTLRTRMFIFSRLEQPLWPSKFE